MSADDPGRGNIGSQVGGDGAGEDGVQQGGADGCAKLLADGDGRRCDTRVLRCDTEGAGVDDCGQIGREYEAALSGRNATPVTSGE
jgi:hypothetical protein